MFQRFTRVLFGDEMVDGRGCPAQLSFNEKKDDDEWILLDYLADACTASCGKEAAGPCSEDVPASDCQAIYSPCSSLDSAFEDGGFLRLEACTMEESWFVTPPPCFVAEGQASLPLETNPLEDLLMEHPSMSIYTLHNPSITRAVAPTAPSTGPFSGTVTAGVAQP